MAIEFTTPIWLWLALAIPVLWVWPRRLRDLKHGAIRSVVVALLILALAGPTVPGEETRAHHVLLLDTTTSVLLGDSSSTVTGLQSLGRRLGDDRAILLSMGEGGETSLANSSWERSERFTSDRTPLGAALAVAGSQIPAGTHGSVTLISDGHSTSHDWGPAAQALAARGIPVHVDILRGPPETDLRPVGLFVEEPLRAGATARAHVDLIGSAIATVTLSSGEAVLAVREGVAVDGRTRVMLPIEPEESGFLPLVVTVSATEGTDEFPGTNSFATEVAVQDPLRVLYLGERIAEGRERLEELVGSGFDFEEREDLTAEPNLDRFDLVMIDDRPAETMPASFQEAVDEAVRERGLGLLMSGGGGSFGPGGYHDSPLAQTLPIEFIQKEEKKDPSTALAIIIDTSGSMGGNRIILAKETARLAIRRLLPHDKVGIVEFYGTKRWAAPLQSAANAIDIQRALNRLDAGGGTILLPAIEEAYYGLRNMQTRYKHVLMLTDAGVETGPYESLLRRMARDGICVSTVLVGPARHGEFLVQLADWGNGRYYNASDRFNLPEIMLKQPSTARLPAYRPGVQAVEPRGGAGWWGEVDPLGVPSVSGYVETRARPGAEVLLRTRTDGHPVLASWRAGLGRATAFLTEPVGPGTTGWEEWPEYGAFLARVLSRTAADGVGPYRWSLEEDGTRLDVIAERRERAAPLPRASRLGEGETATALEFHERAPGRFVATLGRDPAAAVRIACGTVDPARGAWRLVSPAHPGGSPEGQVDPAHALDLAALAAATGGSVIGDLGSFNPTAGGGGAPRGIRELAPLCSLLALLAFLGEILYRRSRSHPGMEA